MDIKKYLDFFKINLNSVTLIKSIRFTLSWKYFISDFDTVRNGSGLVELIILLFWSVPFLCSWNNEWPDLCPQTSFPQTIMVSTLGFLFTYLIIESIPLFSESRRPTIDIWFRISEFAKFLSKSMLERVQIAI